MKKILIALAVVLFTINVGAQQGTPKTSAKKESCCKKTMTDQDIAKCQKKCKSEGKVCTAGEMAKCKKETKSCCAKK